MNRLQGWWDIAFQKIEVDVNCLRDVLAVFSGAFVVKDFMKSYHIHINTGQPFIPCSLKHTDIPFILSSVIQARQCIDIITIRCFLMALKKLQFLFSLFGKVFPLFISPILVYIHTFLNFSSNLSNCILDFAY